MLKSGFGRLRVSFRFISVFEFTGAGMELVGSEKYDMSSNSERLIGGMRKLLTE